MADHFHWLCIVLQYNLLCGKVNAYIVPMTEVIAKNEGRLYSLHYVKGVWTGSFRNIEGHPDLVGHLVDLATYTLYLDDISRADLLDV